MSKPHKHLLLSILLIAIGLAGFLVGHYLWPKSNLIGGWAFVFGPVSLVGYALLFLASQRLVVDWINRRRAQGQAGSDNPR
tara:strand:+ start:10743 stop:10985 length:243 start_codon:yes stop_codon:yes gene_type:complete